MKPETMTAIASTVIAAAALIVAFWSEHLTRKHNELSVEPILKITFANHPEEEYSGFLVSNVGLGPAKITSLSVSVDNQLMPDLGYSGVKTALSNLKIDRDWVTITKLNSETVIPAGKTVPLISVSRKNYEDHINSILGIKKRVGLKLMYESMYHVKASVAYGPK
ncbi:MULTISPECIES: hypothetical protein [unclassified Pseudoalteromonas]|uniref:hypothetical protein n=1 Tax=unclassified Pseudoalteromonas TaxID=194690 RepID=UPI0030153F02